MSLLMKYDESAVLYVPATVIIATRVALILVETATTSVSACPREFDHANPSSQF